MNIGFQPARSSHFGSRPLPVPRAVLPPGTLCAPCVSAFSCSSFFPRHSSPATSSLAKPHGALSGFSLFPFNFRLSIEDPDPVGTVDRLRLTPFHQSQITKSCRIRTCTKRDCNSCRIRTSKTQDLKPFRIRTYRKTGGGVPSKSPNAHTPPRKSQVTGRQSRDLDFEDYRQDQRPLGGLLTYVPLEVDADFFLDDAPIGFFFGVGLLDGFHDDFARAGD